MAFIFKKKKNPKQIVDGLLDHITALPSKSKVEAVAKVAMANAEESLTGSMRKQKDAAPGSIRSKDAGSSGSEEVTQTTTASADGAVGVGDGLSPNDLAALDGLEKRLAEIRVILTGTADSPPKEDESSQLARFLLDADVPMKLLSNLGSVTFETRKSIVIVFNFLLHVQEPLELQTIVSRYLRSRAKEIIRLLLSYYSMENLALHAGDMMRQCLVHPSLYHECLSDDMVVLNHFFDTFLQMDSFEICSDAFATFRDILTKQKQFVSEFLEKNYEQFFPKYTALLQSEQYVTQRQSLKLLSELLLDRQNYNTMIRFIGDKKNLILVMNLMRVKSPAMRLEAFHVFKIFVANPHKTQEITEILQRNRDKLVAYLKNFTTEREDENFQEERKLLISTMVALPPFEKKEGEAA
mmetsp:Transcript_10562/g.12044  ORF Transcript_10562/g.12044 Transcript_10562/m.12044 type:complete len:410 (-) Transcript_10562:352-1581(-)